MQPGNPAWGQTLVWGPYCGCAIYSKTIGRDSKRVFIVSGSQPSSSSLCGMIVFWLFCVSFCSRNSSEARRLCSTFRARR
jgi:hypothetical protein